MDCAHGGQSAKVGGLALGLADWLSVAGIRERSFDSTFGKRNWALKRWSALEPDNGGHDAVALGHPVQDKR